MVLWLFERLLLLMMLLLVLLLVVVMSVLWLDCALFGGGGVGGAVVGALVGDVGVVVVVVFGAIVGAVSLFCRLVRQGCSRCHPGWHISAKMRE